MIRLDEIDIKILEDIQQRLVEDYQGDKEFEQFEEDRIEVGKAIDYLKMRASSVKKRLYDKYKGYAYLDGFAFLVYIVETFEIGTDVMTIYELTGKHFDKTPSSVERVIRNFRNLADIDEPSKTNKAFLVKNMIEFGD